MSTFSLIATVVGTYFMLGGMVAVVLRGPMMQLTEQYVERLHPGLMVDGDADSSKRLMMRFMFFILILQWPKLIRACVQRLQGRGDWTIPGASPAFKPVPVEAAVPVPVRMNREGIRQQLIGAILFAISDQGRHLDRHMGDPVLEGSWTLDELDAMSFEEIEAIFTPYYESRVPWFKKATP